MTVWSTDPDAAAPVLHVLAEGYDLAPLDTLPDPAAIPETGLLLLHLAPATALARTMAAGTGPVAALRGWQDQARAILALNRRDRRRARVLDIAAAMAHPGAFRDRFGLPDGPGPGVARRNAQDDPFLLTLAQRMLHGDPQSRSLMAELEAVSIDLSGGAAPADPVDPEAVFRAWLDNREARDELLALRGEMDGLRAGHATAETALQEARQTIALLQGQNRELQDEIDSLVRRIAGTEAELARHEEERRTAQGMVDLLQAQGRELQEELERLARRNAGLEEAAAALPALNRKLAETTQALRRRIADKDASLRAADGLLRRIGAERAALGADLVRLRRRLAEDREEIAGKQARIVGLEAELGELRGALDRTGTELRQVYASRSYRMTGPLRRIRAMFSGRPPA